MTIKQFASLCGCNTQTLRYYDKIDLLKPVRVDQWSGYRYYEKFQAIDFVKIKNLQAADFSIGEIKDLLTMSDTEVYNAFDRKIAEQTKKLERIKEIQQSYLTEKNNMEKLVQSATDFLFHALRDFEVMREFGIDPERGPALVARLKAFYEQTTLRHLQSAQEVKMLLNGEEVRGTDAMIDTLAALKDKGYGDTVLLGDQDVGKSGELTPENGETVWQSHGWAFVREFITDIPDLERGFEYSFYFLLTKEKHPGEGLEFPMFLIAIMLERMGEEADRISVGCNIQSSTDGKNHFLLLRRKE